MTNAPSRASRGRARAERLETRVTAEQKNLIERAAALQGRTLTDFVLTSVQGAARRAIEEHQRLEFSVRDSEAIAIPADSFARMVAFAMGQPGEIEVNEILFRPPRQEG